MPSTCCVYGCKGNYSSQHVKVSVFKFPEDSELRKIWCERTLRKNFKPTKSSKVCELHFRKEDILWETEFFDERTGRLLKAKLKFPKLKKGAVPMYVFKGCPSHQQLNTTAHVSSSKRRKKLDDALVIKAKEKADDQLEKSGSEISFSGSLLPTMTKYQLRESMEIDSEQQPLSDKDCISESVSPKVVSISENSSLLFFGESKEVNESTLHGNTLEKQIIIKQEPPDDILYETSSSTAVEAQNLVIASIAPALITAPPSPIMKFSFSRLTESNVLQPSNIGCAASSFSKNDLLSNNLTNSAEEANRNAYIKSNDDNQITSSETLQLENCDHNIDPSLLQNEGRHNPFRINKIRQSVAVKAANALTSMAERNCLVLERIAKAIEVQAAQSVKIATAIEIQATQSVKQTQLIDQLIDILSKK